MLGSTFAPDPAHPVAMGMADKLNDAIMLQDVNEQVLEQVEGLPCSALFTLPALSRSLPHF